MSKRLRYLYVSLSGKHLTFMHMNHTKVGSMQKAMTSQNPGKPTALGRSEKRSPQSCTPPPHSAFRKSGHPRKSNGPVPGENGITPVLAPPLAFVPA